MKESYLFEYIRCDSPLCRVNPLTKLFVLIAVCITAAALQSRYIFFILPVFIPLTIAAGRATGIQLRAMWKLYIFFAVSGGIKGLSYSSVMEGLAFSSLLLIMFLSGLIFYTTSRLSELRLAVEKVLSFLPFINAERVSGLITMTMSFLPLIFKSSREMSEAQYSRGFRPGVRPVRTLKLKSVPLLINLFIKSDELADSYYSRGYGSLKKK